MNYNPPYESLGKTLTYIIRVMRNIGFTASPDISKSTPEKLGSTIDKMAHELPAIC